MQFRFFPFLIALYFVLACSRDEFRIAETIPGSIQNGDGNGVQGMLSIEISKVYIRKSNSIPATPVEYKEVIISTPSGSSFLISKEELPLLPTPGEVIQLSMRPPISVLLDGPNIKYGGNTFISAPDSHKLFVTSKRFEAGTIGGLQNADEICRLHAAKGEKTKYVAGNWRAIASAPGENAHYRITLNPLKILVNSQNEVLKLNPVNLWSTPLLTAIRFDENGIEIPPNALVFTGTNPNGVESNSCNGWTDTSYGVTVTVGDPHSTHSSFSLRGSFPQAECTNTIGHLYCINLDNYLQ